MNKAIGKRTYGIAFFLGGAMVSGLISAMTVLFCAVDNYTWLVLLPLSFCLISLIFNKVYKLIGKSITVSLLIALMYLKNVIIPVFMALGGGYFAARVDTASKMLPAVMLLIYEEVVVFMVLYSRLKTLRQSIAHSFMGKLDVRKDKIKSFTIITLMILLVAVVCLALYPQLVSYTVIGVLGETDKVIQQNYLQILMKETVPTVIYYTYTLCINLLRWLVPAMLMFRLYISRKKEATKILLSFIAIGMAVILVTDIVAISVFIAVAYSLLMCKMYPMQRKKIIIVAVSAVGTVGTLALILKTFGSYGFENDAIGEIAYMLQAYFSGPENVAVALAINTPLTISEMFGDLAKFIPYLLYFFKELPSSTAAFNATYWGTSDITNQIIPMISQGARHFTFVFAPIYTAVITAVAVKWEIKATRKGALLDYAVCSIGCIFFSLSIAMYNASLCFQMYLNYVLPIQLIVWSVKKMVIKVKTVGR